MAGPLFYDRVQETTTTTGTGSYALGGATTGFQAWSAVGSGNTAYYMVTDGTNWETGLGTYSSTGPTLARTTVLESSNANAAVSWGAGTKTISLVDPATFLTAVEALVAAGTTGSGAVVLATSPTLVTPNLGTPSAITLTHGTSLPISTGVSGLGSGVETFLATPNSANLAAAVTDETGSGSLVFANSPALTGSPTAPTQSSGDNSTKIATTAYVDAAAAVPTSSALPIGWSGVMYNGSGSSVADGATTAGTGLSIYVDNGAAQSGTWKNITGASVANGIAGLFVRTA